MQTNHTVNKNLFLFPLICIFLLPGILYAEFPFSIGNFNLFLTPTIAVQEEYNDNIFLSRIVERSDWITTISPGFTLHLLQSRVTIDLTYSPGLVYFLHNPQFDYTSHDQFFSGFFNLTPRLTFSLDQKFIRTNDPEIEDTSYLEQELLLTRDARFELDRISVSPRLDYQFGIENSLAASYRYINSNNKDPREDDFTQQDADISLTYWFNRKNGFDLLFGYERGDFEEDTDLLNAYNFTGRYRYRFTQHLEVFTEGSAVLRDYEETRTLQVRTNPIGIPRRTIVSEDLEDEDIYRSKIGLTYSYSPTMDLAGSFGYYWRKGADGDDDGFNTMLRLTKTNRKLTFVLSWTNGFRTDDFAYRDSGSYEYWTISTDLNYLYSQRLEFNLSGSYGTNDYSTSRATTAAVDIRDENRDDDIYRSRFSVNYQLFKHISLEFEFRHDEVDSNQVEQYYIVNRCIGRITATF